LVENPVVMVMKSPDISANDGKPSAVRAFTADATRYIEATGRAFRTTSVGLENSITFEFTPEVSQSARDELRDIAEATPERELDPAELERLVPDSVLAGVEAAQILSLPPEDAFKEARALRSKLAKAYGDLSRTLVEYEGSILVDGLAANTEFSLARAKEAVEILDNPKPAPPLELEVHGTLVGADSSAAQFKLRIDPDRHPEELAPQQRFIEGAYTTAAREAARRGGLWDRKVVAKIRFFRVQEPDRINPTLKEADFFGLRAND
jgi:hypothetical protein